MAILWLAHPSTDIHRRVARLHRPHPRVQGPLPHDPGVIPTVPSTYDDDDTYLHLGYPHHLWAGRCGCTASARAPHLTDPSVTRRRLLTH